MPALACVVVIGLVVTPLGASASVGARRANAVVSVPRILHGRVILPADPVVGSEFPDPSVIAVSSRYYGFSTQTGGSNIGALASGVLGRWTTLSDALPALPPWAVRGRTWAPAVATDPAGPYVDAERHPFLCQRTVGGSIDPYVFSIAERRYLLW